MIIPYIEKNFFNRIYSNKWVYVKDDFLDDIWSIITNPYKDVLFKHFGIDTTKSVISKPFSEVLDDKKSEYCKDEVKIDGDIPYFRDNKFIPVVFRFLSSKEIQYLRANTYNYFHGIFKERIHNIFDENNIYTLVTKPQKADLINYRDLCIKNNYIMHISFTKNIIDTNREDEESLKALCNRIGYSLSKIYKNPEEIDKRIDDLDLISNSGSIFNSTYPSQLVINYRSKDYKAKFRTIAYKNGKIVIDKKGRVVPYAYTEMQLKINKIIKSSKPTDKWVLVNGFINYLNDTKK